MLISYFCLSFWGRRPPDPVSGLCPWTPLGDFRLPQPLARPLFSIIPNPPCELHPIVKSWVRLWLRGQKCGVHTGHSSLARGPGVASGEEKGERGNKAPKVENLAAFACQKAANSPHSPHFRNWQRQAPTPSTQNASDLQQCQEQLLKKSWVETSTRGDAPGA